MRVFSVVKKKIKRYNTLWSCINLNTIDQILTVTDEGGKNEKEKVFGITFIRSIVHDSAWRLSG